MPEPTRYGTAESRWSGVGPYYAMFPTAFAQEVVREHTKEGELVLDPFAGRGTSTFAAACLGRPSIGIEISPVGFVYSKAKSCPAAIERVIDAFARVTKKAEKHRFHQAALDLPPFFRRCYTMWVRQFLLAARAELDWRKSRADCTAMALILVYLHGKRDMALSNQMRQTKAMAPDYALRWWRKNDEYPPDLDPFEFLLKRLEWRYAKGHPQGASSSVYLGDSLQVLPRLARALGNRPLKASLLFTSPPYYRVTNYHYDQWLRLWMLGAPPTPRSLGTKFTGRFENRDNYFDLIRGVFERARPLLKRNAVIYVRTDSRTFTRDVTIQAVRGAFPNKMVSISRRGIWRPTQTNLFDENARSAAEVDLVLHPR